LQQDARAAAAAAATAAGGPDGPLTTYTIMTVDSSPKLTWLHNRMPVLLEDDAAVEAWLSGSSSSSSSGSGRGIELQPHSDSQNEQQQQQQQGEGGVSSQDSEGKEAGGTAAAAKEGKASAFKLVNQVSSILYFELANCTGYDSLAATMI
jgi:hypothetical protein